MTAIRAQSGERADAGRRSGARRALSLPWLALKKWFGDGSPAMAGSLAFATVFSMPALLALVLMLIGWFVDPGEVQRLIVGQIRALVGPAGAQQIETVISYARQSDVDPSLTAILGLVALAFGATTGFAQLQAGLNRAWNVKPDPRRGDIRNFLAKRVFSFGVVLVVAFLLLVSLVLSAFLGAIGDAAGRFLGLGETVLIAANAAFSFAVIVMLFAAMFKLLPDARIAWRDVWVGGVVTAILFVGGKELIGLYLGSADPGTAYGAAGSLMLVLVWIYYSSMILLYGAEFTRVWAEEYGSGITPQHGAIEYVEVEKPVQRG